MKGQRLRRCPFFMRRIRFVQYERISVMKDFQEKAWCPVMGDKKCLIGEMVNDHPWLWVGACFLMGILLGRHRCCRKKKCKKS